VRFDDEGQELFDAWRRILETRLREDSLHPMMEAHLAKYRSLVPSLALLIHLAEGAFVSSVSPISEAGPGYPLAMRRWRLSLF
jgi:hypothetical protein